MRFVARWRPFACASRPASTRRWTAGLAPRRMFQKERRLSMSRDYHATEFIGRLAADPETKYTETNGTPRTRFRVLVNEEWKDRNDQVQKHVESYTVVCFNGVAEACGNYLSQGRR